jgi:hypothetical protein
MDEKDPRAESLAATFAKLYRQRQPNFQPELNGIDEMAATINQRFQRGVPGRKR